MSTTAVTNLVIRASAGSGKTFQLANRFLGLASDGTATDQILAATFARKAAGEILERIVVRLAEAAGDPAAVGELAKHLNRPDLSAARCSQLLRELIGRLHRLQIGTLDSFFVQLATHFGLELGLPLGWRIVDELDDARLRNDAIRRVLERHSSSDSAKLVHLLSKGEATRSVVQQIADIVSGLYGVFLDTEAPAWHALPRLKELEKSALNDALTQFRDAPLPADKTWANAHGKALAAAERGDWGSFLANGIAAKLVAGESKFSRKEIEPPVAAAYQALIEQARAVLVNRLAVQTEGTHEMLSRFHATYQELRGTERVMRFDDVTRALKTGLGEHGIDGLAYRLDCAVAHLLLDEFQDTSLTQWEVLLPFARRATDGGIGRSFFCVGDVKQAIYGWRGGMAEIFDSAVRQLPKIGEQSLVESFRSAPAVIDTVNRVFGDLPHNDPLTDFSAVTDAWHKRFQPHSTAKKHLAGRCRLLVAPRAAEGEKQDACTLRFAAKHIAGLAAENPESSIGVLVRRNKAIAPLIYELRTTHEVSASEEGGNPLTDSVAVQLILSLFKLADHPGDTAARFHVAKSPLGPIVGLTDFADNAAAQRLAHAIRQQLLTDGYGCTIYGWTKALAPQLDLRDLNRLLQLVEMAYRLDDGQLRRPDQFILQVQERRVEDPTAANVRVMTVHQAKGLQFDMVVLPELDVKFKGQTPTLVVDRPDPLASIERVCRYANEQIQALLPAECRPMFARWPNQSVAEGLCVLYVAMTRAIHSLDMIVAPAKETEKALPKTYGGLLRAALAPNKRALPETTLFDHSNAATPLRVLPLPEGEGTVLRRAAHPHEEYLDVALRPSAAKRRRGLNYQTPSGMEGSREIDLGQCLRLESRGGMTRGAIVHAWLEQIAWLEDGIPDDATLRQLAGEWAGPEVDLAAEIRRFREMLSRPTLRAALARDSCRKKWPAAELELFTERKFAVREENAIVQGAIDRLVLIRRGGKLVAADIVDFKTDAVADPAAIAERVKFYRPQLEAYRRCLAKLTGLGEKQIAARLLFVEPGVEEVV